MIKPITVLMSIYKNSNPEEFQDAFLSITTKQIYKPAQFVLVIDGPISDTLKQSIEKVKNSFRGILTIINLEKNQGLAEALNIGLKNCFYDLVARMDADDISVPERLKLQFDFMNSNHQITALGGQVSGWTQDFNKCLFHKKVPTDYESLYLYAKKRCPINHPTVMYRKSTIIKVGAYPSVFPEDYLLWVTLLKNNYQICNLPQILVKMRVENSIKNRRGMTVVPGEIRTFKTMLELGFISRTEFITALLCRLPFRLLPYPIKLFLYKIFS